MILSMAGAVLLDGVPQSSMVSQRENKGSARKFLYNINNYKL
jgi:hypothetical protein